MTGHSLLQCPFFMYWQQFIFFLTRIFLQSCLSNFSYLFTGQLLVAKCSLSIPIPSSLIDVYFQLLFHLTFQHLQEVCGSIFSCGTLIFWDGSANSSVPLMIKFQRWCVASMSFIVKAVQVVGLGIFFCPVLVTHCPGMFSFSRSHGDSPFHSLLFTREENTQY